VGEDLMANPRGFVDSYRRAIREDFADMLRRLRNGERPA